MGKLAIVFSVALSAFLLSASDDRPVPSAGAFSKTTEDMRVTSPNGQFDAVLVTDITGGAAGGSVDSNVYIVRKGSPVRIKNGTEVFSADPMTCGELVWKRDHLLEIHYEIAYIHNFRNLWGQHEIENTGSVGEHDFEVEIELVPSAESSALDADGDFRRRGVDEVLHKCAGNGVNP